MSERRGYHHGDLKAALVKAAIELVAERGVRGFSMAMLSRRLGVAVSAPYAHFADREALLAAVAVRGYEDFHADLLAELTDVSAPEARLAAIARAYVRFAGTRQALFDVLFLAGVAKAAHPEVEAAEREVDAVFADCVAALGAEGTELATAVEATAHGYAMLLIAGDLGTDENAVDVAAEGAARATLALAEARHRLHE
jgi:AcrR family transcriptional regulator